MPLEEPPAVRVKSKGCLVSLGVNIAYSVLTSLPNKTAPASRINCTHFASATGCLPACIGVPRSVKKSLVSITSFTPKGTPWKLERRGSESANAACFKENSGSICANAPTSPLRSSILSRHACVNSTELTSLFSKSLAAWDAVRVSNFII